jgi:hypothetical protein
MGLKGMSNAPKAVSRTETRITTSNWSTGQPRKKRRLDLPSLPSGQVKSSYYESNDSLTLFI